jgi:hypothetical protein
MGSRNRSTDNQTSGAQQYVSAPTVHDRMREQLAKDVEAFLAIGGEIKHLDAQQLKRYRYRIRQLLICSCKGICQQLAAS